MKTISLIIMVAILLEALVEYAKTIITMVEDREYKTATIQAVTIALGIFFAFAFNLQLFNNALVEFYEGLHINDNLDMILTGILFSRGSNYFSDFVTKLTQKQKIQINGEVVELPEDFEELYCDDEEPQTEKDDEVEDEAYIDESEVEESEDETGRG